MTTKINIIGLGALTSLLMSTAAWSAPQADANSESTIQMEDAKPAVSAEQPEVTNAKVKAMSGSRSKFSLQAELTYQGASIEEPFSNKRPNPDNAVVVPQSELSGNLGMAYRFDEKSSLGLGTGVTFVNPAEEGFNESEVSVPYLKYKRTYKAFGVEQITTAKFRYYTGRYRKSGQDTAYTLLQYMAYPIGESAWTLGADLGATYWANSRRVDDLPDYGWGATPFVEYKLSDKFGLTTSVTVGGTHYVRNDGAWNLTSDTIYGDFGVSMAFTDDINVTPKVVYYPDNMKPESTTVAVSAIINML